MPQHAAVRHIARQAACLGERIAYHIATPTFCAYALSIRKRASLHSGILWFGMARAAGAISASGGGKKNVRCLCLKYQHRLLAFACQKTLFWR